MCSVMGAWAPRPLQDVVEALAAGGYEQYEISNWAQGNSESTNQRIKVPFTDSLIRHSPFACRHNLVYWHNEPYLGFGAGAHSFSGERRWWNVKPVPEYIRRIADGRSPEREGEIIDRRLAMGETMMLGLRLVQEGVADVRFRARFGVGLDEMFGAEIAGLVRRGLLERLPDRVRLTPEGKLLGNQVFAEFLPG